MTAKKKTCGNCAWAGRIHEQKVNGKISQCAFCRRGLFGCVSVDFGHIDSNHAEILLGFVRLDTPACPAWEAKP